MRKRSEDMGRIRDATSSEDRGQSGGEISRRKLLAASGTAAVTTLAGCEHIGGGSDETPPEFKPDVTLKDVRVVQTVEDSTITGGNQSIPDPPIVAGEYATVMFDLETTFPENLPETTPLSVTSPGTNFDYTQVLNGSDIRAINNGDEPPAVFHRRANSDGPGDAPNVLKMPADINEITVELFTTNWIDGDEVTLTEGANGDFEVVTVDPLRVGFIPVKDPGATEGVLHRHSSGLELHTTDTDWGDNDGEAKFYERSVASSFEYLNRVYPGEVVGYRHDSHFVAHIRELHDNASGKDASKARWVLDVLRYWPSFPSGGEILTKDIDRQSAIDMMDPFEGGTLDAHVVICPKGTGEDHDDYFDAHWSSNPPSGYHWNYMSAVGAHEARSDTQDDAVHVAISAQEIGHRFAKAPYDDGTSDSFARNNSDESHANANLVSTGYDLTGGSYAVVNDFSIDNGHFTIGSPSGSSVDTYQSYMSYGGRYRWADSRIHRWLIEGGYQVAYSGGTSASTEGAAAAARVQSESSVQSVIDVFGTVEEEQVRFHAATSRRGLPGVHEHDGELDDAATPVEVTVEGPAGEALASAVVPDRHVSSKGEEHTSIAASLPFPAHGVSVVAERDGATTRLNPIVAPIRTLLLEIPLNALANGENTMESLLEILDECDDQMAARRYGAAAETLREEFVAEVDAGVRAYEPYANQPTAAQLLFLTDGHIERLEGLADEQPTRPDSYNLILPDGSTREVEPVVDDQSVEEYYGFDTEGDKSANPPDEVTAPNATVCFVYQDASSGERSLVVIHGDPSDESEDGGAAVMRFGNVTGYGWQVQDGPPGNDAYETANGEFGATESAIWTWPAGRSDGGAFGSLDGAFDVEVVHRGEGTVNEESQERSGLEGWLFIDGADLEAPIELVAFDDRTGDVAIRIDSNS